jgi:tripartite-type tricarboxylate transporter receptor subunit TctC
MIGRVHMGSATGRAANEDRQLPHDPDRRELLLLSASTAAFLSTRARASIEEYPSRPITMIVGYAPGGPTDTRTRIMAEYMKRSLGQSVLVENVTGASGSIGTARVVRAAPDGYTLSSGDWSTHVVNGAIYPLSYNLLSDFEPIALLSSTPLVIITKNAVPATDLRQLLAWLKANQHRASFATSGAGSPSHASGLLLQKMTGMRFRFIPYRGGAQFLQDLIGGQVDLAFGAASNVLPAIRDSKVRAYAITSATRWAAAPEILTVDEAGLSGLHISLWGGLWAPRGTPLAIVHKLNSAVLDALFDSTARMRITALGEEIPSLERLTPEALGAFQKAEIEKWWPILKGTQAE